MFKMKYRRRYLILTGSFVMLRLQVRTTNRRTLDDGIASVRYDEYNTEYKYLYRIRHR